jgi:DNA-binding PadR family transcriptional regulator
MFGRKDNSQSDSNTSSSNFRMKRGSIEPLILHTLSHKPMHGYEIISHLEQQSWGFWRPSAGSVYPTLQLLEDKGLISSQMIDDKKVYQITTAGQQELKGMTNNLHTPWQHRSSFGQSRHHFAQARGHLRQIMLSMRQIANQNSPDKDAKLQKLIEQFSRDLQDLAKAPEVQK